MDDASLTSSLDEIALLAAAEARIDTAMAQLLLTTKGVTDATKAQAVAINELREARNAIKVLRGQVGRQV